MKRILPFQSARSVALLSGLVAVAFSLLVPASVFAQSETQGSDPDAVARVTEIIRYLASDEMGGRAPGTPGMKLAVDYIVKEYEKAGLQPLEDGTYFQELEVGGKRELEEGSAGVVIKGPDGKEFELGDGEFIPLENRNEYDVDAPLVFAGYGIDAGDEHNFDELGACDLTGKVAIIVRREPQQADEDSVFDGTEVSSYAYMSAKVRALRRADAAGIILVNDSFTVEEDGADELVASDQFGRTTQRTPMIHMKREKLEEIIAASPLLDPEGNKLESLKKVEMFIDKNLEPLSQDLEGWTCSMKANFSLKKIKTVNIVGVIEGEGPNADETIVIGGHYDHLGVGNYGSRAANRRGEVHNGADDNATGTAAIIELARRFNERDEKPGRRLVFICFTAEEMGLLGAQHYVQNPLFPLENTVAMINFDMIGWFRNQELTLYNWNTSPQWEGVLDGANKEFDFNLKKPTSGFGGSDHLPFNSAGIPNIFIHTGLTDTYHTPDDDFETIDCAGATRVIDYSEAVVDGMASLKTTPTFGTPKVFRLGVSIRAADGVVTVESVKEGSAADIGGLLEGDVITMIGEEEIQARRNLTRAIRRYKGETATFQLKRDDAEVKLNVFLSDDDVPPPNLDAEEAAEDAAEERAEKAKEEKEKEEGSDG